MNIKEFEASGVIVSMTPDEVLIICNALNEVCNALDIREFAIRMGAERAEALDVMKDFSALYDKIAIHSGSTPLQSAK